MYSGHNSGVLEISFLGGAFLEPTTQPVVCRVAFKPTSSILTPVDSITRGGAATEVRTKGRHDPCVGIRGTPVVEAMMALVLADHMMLHRAQCG